MALLDHGLVKNKIEINGIRKLNVNLRLQKEIFIRLSRGNSWWKTFSIAVFAISTITRMSPGNVVYNKTNYRSFYILRN